MNNQALTLGIYLLIILITTYILLKKETTQSFLIANRKTNLLQIFCSKFSEAIDASWFITFTAYAYEFGTGVFLILIGLIIGYYLYAYWAVPKIYNLSKKQNFYTMGDYVYYITKSQKAKTLVNTISSIPHFLWSLIGIISGAKIISYFGLINYNLAVIITILIIMIYLTLAGYLAVIITDIIQSFIIFFFLGIITFTILFDTNIANILSTTTTNLSTLGFISFLLWGTLSVFSESDRYQLCYSSKNLRSLKKGISLAIIPITICATFLLLIGLLILTNYPNLDSSTVFLKAIQIYLPYNLIPLAIILFFAGIMSSTDTGVYTISSHITLLMFKTNNQKNRIKSIKYIRISSILTLIALLVLALIFKQIIDIAVLSAGITLILSIPMIYLLLGFKNKIKFISSIICAIIGLIVGIVILGIKPDIAIFVLVGSLIGLIFNKKT